MKHHANLLPMSWRRRMMRRRRIRQWSVPWILTALFFAALSITQYAQLIRHGSELQRQRRSSEPLKQQVRTLGDLRAELAQLQSRESLLGVFERRAEPLLVLGMVSRSGQVAENIWIDRFELQNRRSAVLTANQTRSVSNTTFVGSSELMLRGTTKSDQSVTQFVGAIRRYGIFDDVNLRSIQSSGTDGAMDFSVSCQYRK